MNICISQGRVYTPVEYLSVGDYVYLTGSFWDDCLERICGATDSQEHENRFEIEHLDEDERPCVLTDTGYYYLDNNERCALAVSDIVGTETKPDDVEKESGSITLKADVLEKLLKAVYAMSDDGDDHATIKAYAAGFADAYGFDIYN